MVYQVMRHSGRAQPAWRVLYETNNPFKARIRFKKYAALIRRGKIELRKNDEVVAYQWAPHLNLPKVNAEIIV